VSELPKGWVNAYFSDVISSITNGLNGKQNKDAVGIPVSRIETIANQKVNFDRIGYISDFDVEKGDRSKICVRFTLNIQHAVETAFKINT
jgi:type I restriction enzyme S subunit